MVPRVRRALERAGAPRGSRGRRQRLRVLVLREGLAAPRWLLADLQRPDHRQPQAPRGRERRDVDALQRGIGTLGYAIAARFDEVEQLAPV
jgi:hypothetical protein